MSEDDIISQLNPGPKEEDNREERPDPESEKQEQELSDMLEDTGPGSGQTSGSSDPTRVVSEEQSGEDAENGPTTREKGEEVLEDLQEGAEERESAPKNQDVARASVEDVLKREGYNRVDQIALEFEQEMRTGLPALCELGCNVQPNETCPHGHPPITSVQD